ncbi:Methyltransferase type 11 [Lasiodiplodia theobromae]|nr:Methyltransferase type 11 [Lasiodiplodia theobromae]KAF4535194.1 Methyltransferase type 11 [Lasiodiplodia theobromae]
MHHLINILTDGKTFFSPIKSENLKRVLDAGCGTGIWSIEMGDKYPGAEILGNDLSPVQPSWVPPNVKFEVDDLEAPWNHPTPFDLIFCRYLDGAISDWPTLISNMFNHTRPGGWVELQGYDAQYRSDDGTLKAESYLNQYVDTIDKGISKMGKVLSTGPLFEGLLKDAGFINIHIHTYKLPIGTWPKDKKMKEVGTINTLQYLEGMEAFSYRLLTSVLDWKLEEVQVFNAKVAEEIKSNKVHAYYTLYVAYGQKRKDDEE